MPLTRPALPLAAQFAALLAAAAALPAQADWYTPMAVPKARAVHTAAYDLFRNEIVLFGGNTNAGIQGDTWVWSQALGWRNAHPTNAPSARREHAMAPDRSNGVVVLFGGWDGVHKNDTWLWDGTNWTQAAPAVSPGARMPELAFDPVSNRVLMFGGEDNVGVRLDETWSWDGVTWTRLFPATVPPARFDHALATDSARNQVVLFGGWNNVFLGDTWLWNGTDWTAGPAGPSARSEHKMAFAGGDVILFGGDSAAGRLQDTWRWDGTAWTQLAPALSPHVREEHVLVDDLVAGNAALIGGWDAATGHLADHWTFAAGQWTELSPAMPTGTGTGAMAYDPTAQRSILFGGYQDQQVSDQTWSYGSGAWTRLAPATSPPRRAEPALAFDRARNEFVLFGGVDGSTYFSDTWRFAANTWQAAAPAASPPPRWGHAMVFDEARATVLLFSGRQGGTGTNLTDTWEWNGTAWAQLAPAVHPAGREDHSLVFDRGRGATVLFGGWVGGSGFANDTWVFTAGNWNQLPTTNSPSPRAEQMMAYDDGRGRVVMFGGEDAGGRVADTWELATDWIQRTPTRAPEPREEGVMVFDEHAGEVVLAVGWDLGHFTDTWHFASRPAASATAYGAGCAGGAAATPALSSTRPWLGTSFSATAAALPNGAVCLLAFGLGRTNLSLATYGMPGCTALTQPITNLLLPNAGTAASAVLTLPAASAFVGVRMQLQAYAVAIGANPTGVIASNGVELTMALD